jgi:hypothetical protein
VNPSYKGIIEVCEKIPSLGFSKDLAKRPNPRKFFLSHKGER